MTSLPYNGEKPAYLDSVFFGDLTLADYLRVRLSRSPETAVMGPYTRSLTRRQGTRTSPRHVQWIGWISQRVGAYVGTGLYDPASVKAALKIKDYAATWGWRSGLSKKYADNYVAACPTAIIEADVGTLQQQLDELEHLEQEARIKFALLTLSGDTRPASVATANLDPKNLKSGKSIHAELLHESPLDPRDPADEALRLRIQRLLIVLLKADPAIINPDRLMRAGGTVGFHSGKMTSEAGYRIQTLLRAEDVAFQAQAVEAALSAVCCARIGADDEARLDLAIAALVDAHALAAVELGALDYSEAQEIDRLKSSLRTGLAPLAGGDGLVVDAILGRLPPPTRSRIWTGAGGPRRITNGTRSRWDLRTVQWEPLLSLAGLWLGSSQGLWNNSHCPFPHASGKQNVGDCGVIAPRPGQPGGFRCFHGSCNGKTAHDLFNYLEETLGEKEMSKHVSLRGGHMPLDIIGPLDVEVLDLDDLAPVSATTSPGQRWFSDVAGPLSGMDQEIKIVVAAGDLGSGKTTWLAQEIQKVKRVTVIMHRQALSRDVSGVMDVTDYQTVKEPEIDRTIYPKVVITPNSLGRLTAGDIVDLDDIGDLDTKVADDLVILEEVEGTLRHWYGGTLRRERRRGGGVVADPGLGEMVGGDAFAMMLQDAKDCVAAGGRTILSDAFPGGVTTRLVEVLCEHMSLDPKVAVRHIIHHVPLTWQLHVYEELADIVARIAQDVVSGLRVAVACTSARAAVALAQAAQGWIRKDGSLPAVLVHYKGQKTAAKDALCDVRVSWAEPNLLNYSPTADSGVNYDRADKPFDRRYLLALRPGNNRMGSPIPAFGWRVPLQLSRRIRDRAVRDKDIRAFIDPLWKHSQSCDPEVIRAAMVARAKMARAMAKRTAPDGTTYTTALRDFEHFEVAVAVEVARHVDSADVPRFVREAFRRSGVRVVEHPTALGTEELKEFKKNWKKLKDEHDRQTALAWFQGKFLSTDTYRGLRHRQDLDDDQRAAVERTRRVDFVGPKGAELERLQADLRGEERNLVRRHVTFRLVSEGKLVEAATYDRATVEPGFRASFALPAVQSAGLKKYLENGFPVGGKSGCSSIFEKQKCTQIETVEHLESKEENADSENGCTKENSIAPRGAPKSPEIVWCKVPKCTTLADIRTAAGCPHIQDSEEVMVKTLRSIKKGVGKAILAGSGIPTKKMSPNAFVKALWLAAGYKSILWKNTKVKIGKKRKQVRLYTLDPEWLVTLHEISERHYRLATGERVEPLEQIDPKAPQPTSAAGVFTIGERAEMLLDTLLEEPPPQNPLGRGPVPDR